MIVQRPSALRGLYTMILRIQEWVTMSAHLLSQYSMELKNVNHNLVTHQYCQRESGHWLPYASTVSLAFLSDGAASHIRG